MSADNWVICPRCEKRENERIEKLRLNAGNSYGKVSSEEYLEMLKIAEKPMNLKETFREDYSIGLCEGKFSVDYYGYCTVCDLEVTFNHEKEIDISG